MCVCVCVCMYVSIYLYVAHCAIGKPTLFQIIPLYAVNRDDRIFREEIELHFIKKFRPELNRDKINQSEAVQL